MSILLDALKRSEAQRRLGAAPSIHAGGDPGGVHDEDQYRWIPYFLSVATVVTIAWLGIEQYRPPAEFSITGADIKEEAGTVQSALVDPQLSMAKENSEAIEQPGGRTVVENYSPPNEVNDLVSDKNIEHVEMTNRESVNRNDLAERFDRYSNEDSSESVQNNESATQAPEIQPEIADTGGEKRKEIGSRKLDPYKSEPLSYWALPQSIRDDMSEIKITVMVYSEEPSDRFLLVNGQRLLEEEELSGGVRLEEIRRDGAIFRYRNYRFLVDK
jgi:hypothetical protein